MRLFQLSCLIFSVFGQELGPYPGIDTLTPTANVQLRLNQGRVNGYQYRIESLGYDFEIYRGIPYAQYGGRWTYATPLSRFDSNTIDAFTYAPMCAQLGDPTAGIGMTEDCLTLDIYRPVGADKGEILFWIHGGGFAFGDSYTYSGRGFDWLIPGMTWWGRYRVNRSLKTCNRHRTGCSLREYRCNNSIQTWHHGVHE